MFDRKELKTRAKSVLLRSFSKVFLACLIVSFLSNGGLGVSAKKIQGLNLAEMSQVRIIAVCAVIVLLSLIALAYLIFLVNPLSVGLKKFMLENSHGNTSLENLLYPFKNDYKNIVLVKFMKNLYIFLWSLIGFIPIIIAVWKFNLIDTVSSLSLQVQADSIPAAAKLLGILLILLTLSTLFSIPAIIKELQYFMTEYIIAESPDILWKDALYKSKEMMVGNKWGLVKLLISFIPWYILANIFCCFGSFLVTPYFEATFTELYLEISGRGFNASDVSYTEL